MSKRSVFCVVHSRTQAAQIVDGLLSEGFSNHDISGLFPDRDASRNFAYEKHPTAPVGAATYLGVGGLMGGTLGWLAGIGSLAIPSVGPLIVAGPIVAALSDTAVGGIVGTLIGLGIPEHDARRYEEKVKAGKILLSLDVESEDEVAQAKQVLKAHWARNIATSGESSVPEPQDAEDGSDYERSQKANYSVTRR